MKPSIYISIIYLGPIRNKVNTKITCRLSTDVTSRVGLTLAYKAAMMSSLLELGVGKLKVVALFR